MAIFVPIVDYRQMGLRATQCNRINISDLEGRRFSFRVPLSCSLRPPEWKSFRHRVSYSDAAFCSIYSQTVLDGLLHKLAVPLDSTNSQLLHQFIERWPADAQLDGRRRNFAAVLAQ